MQTRRWINQSQPQTLVIAVFLLYFTALWGILGNSTLIGVAIDGNASGKSLFVSDLGNQIENFARLFIVVGAVAGGYLMSNERKLGYWLALGVAALPLVADVIIVVRYQYSPLNFDLVGLLFDIALFALLVHDMTRNYVRIWFK